jgi:diguanylate cyclase (GGDEF)-like protein
MNNKNNIPKCNQLLPEKNCKRVDLLVKLSQKYVRTKPKHSFKMAKRAYNTAKKNEYGIGIASSLCMMGETSWMLGEFEDSISYLLEAIEISKIINTREYETKALIILGNICYDSNDLEKALEYYMESLKIAEKCEYEPQRANALNNIGEIYRKLGAYEDALKCYFESKEIHEKIGTKLKSAIPILNIGMTYMELEEYEKAKEYNELSLKVSMEAGDRLTESYGYYQLAQTYCKLDQNKLALEYYRRSLSIAEETGDRVNQVHILTDLGNLYETESNNGKAIENYKRALNVALELKINAFISRTCSCLASAYEKEKEFEKAIYYYKKFYEAERKESANKLEQNLKNIKTMFKLEQVQKEKEIYQLKNVELKQKTEELERKTLELKKIQNELELANKKLTKLSKVDELTGIPNRRRFEEVINTEWYRAKRELRHLSLIFIDIDHYKEFNDSYGHVAGDDCIRMVAQVLNSAVRRASDFVARYGGDEFVAVLPNTDLRGALKLAERMRSAVENLHIDHKCSNISESVTATLGVACIIPGNNDTLEEFINAADKALYTAKQKGRNRVEAYKIAR